ncbi:MAG: hypothetical protein EBZ77_00175 [Chitinophagia bacterium]|nr:hypothetical protein [Chitinophagia bacterium]
MAILATWLSYGDLLLHPGQIMTELGADGGKNIYTFLWQSMYGHGYWHTGMNYPYGEHLVYTDAQPLFSGLLSWFHPNMNTALGLMGMAIAIAYVTGLLVTQRLLYNLTGRFWLSLVFASLISALSPQCLRISGHYALAYCCVLPLLTYHTLRYHQSGKLKYLFYLALLGVFAIFMHPYYGAVLLVWGALYTLALAMLPGEQKWLLQLLKGLRLMAATTLGFVAFGVVMKLTDPATDRPTVPYGTLQNCTHLADIFTSPYSPLWQPLHQQLAKHAYGEGYCYPGLAVLLLLPLAIYLLRRPQLFNNFKVQPFPMPFLLMAAGALILAMGIPFIWHMEWLLDYVSVFRQFRTLGRFSWIFYYIVTIWCATIAINGHRWLKAAHRSTFAHLLMGGVLLVWVAEVVGYSAKQRAATHHGLENYATFTSQGGTSWPALLSSKAYKPSDFQAILVLPFFETGSEKLWLCSDENASAWAVAIGIKAGLPLHLPIVDAMLSRTPWTTALMQAKWAGGPYVDKPVLRDLPNRKPMLLLVSDYTALPPGQQYIVAHATYIGKYTDCTAYACYPDSLTNADSLACYSALQLVKSGRRRDTCVGAVMPPIHRQWGHPFTTQQPTALPYTDGMSPVLLDTAVYPPANVPMEFSVWFQVPGNNYTSPSCTISLYNAEGHLLQNVLAETKESTDNHGLALRTEAHFVLPAAARRIRVTVNNLNERPFTSVNNLYLIPEGAIVVRHLYITEYEVNNHIVHDWQKGCEYYY